MKWRAKSSFLLIVLTSGFGLISAGQVTAQTFTVLHTFTNGLDGGRPVGGLVISGNTLYGTASVGGSSGNGAVFSLNTDGTGFTNLHSFTALSGFFPETNADGVNPLGGLLLSSNTLYGTAYGGGSSGNGTVFAMNTDGTGFTNLYSFTAKLGTTNNDGANPQGSLILSGNTLYSTASYGGSSASGTVFAVNTDGTGFTILHTFSALSASAPNSNSDGANPVDGLLLSGNTLYGTTPIGGSSGFGTLFALKTDGTGFTNLHSFTRTLDGGQPNASLILSGSTIYGTAAMGSGSQAGLVFSVNTNGTDFTNLWRFAGGTNGAGPGKVILSGNTLYGTTGSGGEPLFGYGIVFAINTNGTGFTNLHAFIGSKDGTEPEGQLIMSDNTLYGTAVFGGSSSAGTVFSLTLGPISPPQLTVAPSAATVLLMWPTNAPGFTLQSTPSLVPPVLWTSVTPGPVVVNGQNIVTNPISGDQQYYRLSR